jgi:hypothetical protein
MVACRHNRDMSDRATAAADTASLKNLRKVDSMLDTMPGGEMARGNDSATMHLMKKKKRM